MLSFAQRAAVTLIFVAPLFFHVDSAEARSRQEPGLVKSKLRCAQKARRGRFHNRRCRRSPSRPIHSAPELDPTAATSVVLLLAGAGIMMLDRRRYSTGIKRIRD